MYFANVPSTQKPNPVGYAKEWDVDRLPPREAKDVPLSEKKRFLLGGLKRKSSFQNEKAFVEFIEETLHPLAEYLNLPPIKAIEKERRLGNGNLQIFHGRVDMVLTHTDGSLTVIEAKIPKGVNDVIKAIAQTMFYQTFLRQETGLPQESIRLVVICDKLTLYAPTVVKDFNLPIRLFAMQTDGFAEIRPI